MRPMLTRERFSGSNCLAVVRIGKDCQLPGNSIPLGPPAHKKYFIQGGLLATRHFPGIDLRFGLAQ